MENLMEEEDVKNFVEGWRNDQKEEKMKKGGEVCSEGVRGMGRTIYCTFQCAKT